MKRSEKKILFYFALFTVAMWVVGGGFAGSGTPRDEDFYQH